MIVYDSLLSNHPKKNTKQYSMTQDTTQGGFENLYFPFHWAWGNHYILVNSLKQQNTPIFVVVKGLIYLKIGVFCCFKLYSY